MEETKYNNDDQDSQQQQEEEEQLPSLEELANVQFTIPLNPKDYAKPFFYGGLGLFTIGLAAGTVVSGVTKPPPQTEQHKLEAVMAARAEGFRLASRALLYGTCLCGVFALVGVYTVHKVANVNSMEEWVEKLKVWVPQKRDTMEQQLQPILNRIRDTGNSTIPSHWQNWQQRFHDASFGKWLIRKTKYGWSENQTRQDQDDNSTT